MAKILSHPRVYSFLHVPVQSGSDAVLGEMKREYTIEQFRKVVDYLKEQLSKERESEGGSFFILFTFLIILEFLALP